MRLLFSLPYYHTHTRPSPPVYPLHYPLPTRLTMSLQFPTQGIQNAQRQSNQFLLTQQYESAIDQLNVYPGVNAASNESIASLGAMFGQSAPSGPARENDDSLSQELRADRPSLCTRRALLHQNPFPVPSREGTDFSDTLYTGGNIDFLMDLERSADMPTTSNSALNVGTGLNVQNEQLFMGGENQPRSEVRKRKREAMVDVNIAPIMEFRRMNLGTI